MKAKNKTYRLSLADNETHDEIRTILFTKPRFIIAAVTTLTAGILLLYCLIAFTPLKNTIPGYPDVHVKKAAMSNAMKIDSLERVITRWNLYAGNLSRVLAGEAAVNFDSLAKKSDVQYLSSKSEAELAGRDSVLRETVRKEERFGVSSSPEQRSLPLEGRHFFTPVKGVPAENFDRAGHPGLDINAAAGSIVGAILDGTVVYSERTPDNMYVVIVQHEGNLLSLYGNCSRVLRREGEIVKAGTPIAASGAGGHGSGTGMLHLEIWNGGEPLDPAEYLNL